jgi:hypothetical protein
VGSYLDETSLSTIDGGSENKELEHCDLECGNRRCFLRLPVMTDRRICSYRFGWLAVLGGKKSLFLLENLYDILQANRGTHFETDCRVFICK